ncbi:hypothetical protein HK096_003014 [Nowakowskiella sp. JEL0078]|nr:hypothetical protein HK096_003014 [Nowakowskiella sp. JEL0078]
MEYVRFGETGMKVSKVCVGCMSYGSSKFEPWILDEDESLVLIKKAWDKFNIPREQVVIATKVFFHVADNLSSNVFWQPKDSPSPKTVNQSGLSRKHIFEAVEKSLERLGTTYIDLYQIHRFDYETPVEETMEALNDLVRSGKVRYIGASSMWAWQFAKLNAVAEKNGWAKFVSMQNLYNLLYREEEREMIPLLQDQGIAMIPWSPLASGKLGGKKNGETERSSTDVRLSRYIGEQDSRIISRVFNIAARLTAESADGKEITPAIVSLAWMYSKKFVTAPIIGLGKEKYLIDSLAAIKLKLSIDDIKYLEEEYSPRPILGHY